MGSDVSSFAVLDLGRGPRSGGDETTGRPRSLVVFRKVGIGRGQSWSWRSLVGRRYLGGSDSGDSTEGRREGSRVRRDSGVSLGASVGTLEVSTDRNPRNETLWGSTSSSGIRHRVARPNQNTVEGSMGNPMPKIVGEYVFPSP